MLETLGQLSEATEKTKTGVKHTADAGGYGRKFDTDEEGDEKKKDATPAAKRGRGRPAKGSDETGNVKKYDDKALSSVFGGGKKPKKEVGTVSKKHTLKDWFERVDAEFIAEAEQVTMEPAKQNTQVIKQGTKTLGTVSNPQLAAQIKQSIGKGEMSLAGDQLGEEELDELSPGTIQSAAAKRDAQQPGQMSQATQRKDPMVHATNRINMTNRVEEEDYSATKARAGKDIGKPGKNFAKIAKSAAAKYGSKEKGEKVAGAVLAKLRSKTNEVEQPTMDNMTAMGAGLGAGRSQTTLEGKKPDFLDLDKDGNKKESMKKAAADKKKVKEGMNHKLQAARLEGKAHGLKGHAYHGKAFEDMEEARMYHEGFKEGLDECYGMKPIQGMVDEMDAPATPPATVSGMADQAMEMATMEDEMDEGNAFTAALAKTPKGGKFSVGGKTFTDRSDYSSKIDEFAFESLDRELQNLLKESDEKIEEGMSVSITKGQQNMPDSVSVTAQDGEAEELLGLIKSLGGGLFGGEEQHSDYGAPQAGADHGGIKVVDDHDGMLALMKKMSGGDEHGSEDYADEEGHDHDDEMCNECGTMMTAEGGCGCDESKEMVDEVESEDQMEFEVAEDNAPDSEEAEHTADEEAEAQEDMALAKSDQQNKTTTFNEGGDGPEASEEGEEDMSASGDEDGEEVNESFNLQDLYKKLVFMEESTAEKDDKAEKAGKKVAKDIEYDEGHKGKDDDKAERAGKKVAKDIEYDDKKDKKEKVDEWANQTGPGPGKGTDASFEQDIDFMTKVIAGGLNKPKSTGQTTIPVVASQLNRTVSHNTTDINESVNDWKKLAGIK